SGDRVIGERFVQHADARSPLVKPARQVIRAPKSVRGSILEPPQQEALQRSKLALRRVAREAERDRWRSLEIRIPPGIRKRGLRIPRPGSLCPEDSAGGRCPVTCPQ